MVRIIVSHEAPSFSSKFDTRQTTVTSLGILKAASANGVGGAVTRYMDVRGDPKVVNSIISKLDASTRSYIINVSVKK